MVFYLLLAMQVFAALIALLGAVGFVYMLLAKREKLDGLLLYASQTILHVRPGMRWLVVAVGIFVGIAVVASIAKQQ